MSKALTFEETREKLPRQVKNLKNTIEVDDMSEDENVEVEKYNQLKGPMVTVTGKSLDQQKMLKRKIKNCDNKGWITLNRNAGSYPKQAKVTLKTGMFELFQSNFLKMMEKFSIFPMTKMNPEESIKITMNDNGVERIEYDLKMELDNLSVNLKVKIYLTISAFDVQGLKPHFETVFEELGNRTIAVYFVDVVLEAIFQSMMNECNLEDYNKHCKSQATIGLESKNADVKTKKAKTKVQDSKVKRCNICDSNSKELNSFKCHECLQFFHKNCVNKRTSNEEFSLIKKGDISFNCEDCMKARLGIDIPRSFKMIENIATIDVSVEVGEQPVIEESEKEIVESVLLTTQAQAAIIPPCQQPDTNETVLTNKANNEETTGAEDELITKSKDVNSISTQTDEGGCNNCECIEAQKLDLVRDMEKMHDTASKMHTNIEQLVKENEELKEKLENVTVVENNEGEKLQRAILDIDRIKFLYEKANKEIAKLTEVHKKEIKELVSQKLEVDYRYDSIVKEREKFAEKERILLNTFDLWKAKFETPGMPKETEKSAEFKCDECEYTVEESAKIKEHKQGKHGGHIYECDECVYEATTLSDLDEHKRTNHNEQFKCGECGHTVLSSSDLNGHKEAYHRKASNDDESIQSIFLCDHCDKEFLVKKDLEDHIKKDHTKDEDFSCEKCDFIGLSMETLENHRRTKHFLFVYFCGECNYETTNIGVLKEHKRTKHGRRPSETKKVKVNPPPKCNLEDALHSSECCDRKPGAGKAVIYSQEQKHKNGICLDWNKGSCENFELCKYLHVEIEACRYANFCSRSNCTYWHDTEGKFPFLEETSFRRGNRNHQ